MTSDAFTWWLVIEAAGLIALPITLLVFRRLPGAGYAFSKPVGLLLGAYLFWLALSLPCIAEPSRQHRLGVPAAFIALDVYLIKRYVDELRAMITERASFILAVEVVFTLSFAVAVYLRSFVPDIAGTEKPMDFMLLNAASRSQYYPPDDAWLSGFEVSYYYFGYVIQAMIAKLSVVPTSIAFNLGLASTAALAATAAFGLASELIRLGRASLRAGIIAGLAAATFLVVLGNLEGVIEFAIANGYVSKGFVSSVNIHDLEQARESSACLQPLFGFCVDYPNEESSFWWWWRATRISPDGNSITEFPFFSFLLGDLHPHVMALPLVLTVFGLGVSFWRSSEPLDWRAWRRRPLLLILSSLLVGGLGFLNTWDLPTFLFLLGLLVLARNLIDQTTPAQRPLERLARAVLASAGFVLPLALLAFALYLPFYLSFSSQAGGIDAVQTAGTLPLHSILFWGPLVAVTLPLPLVMLNRESLQPRRVAAVCALLLLLLVAWAAHIVFYDGAGALGDAISERGSSWLTAMFFGGALGVTLLTLWSALSADDDTHDATIPVLIATGTAFLLILGAELFYIEDVFNSRLNTVFKLSYQAWILLAVSGGFSLYWMVREWQPDPGTSGELLRGAWGGLAALAIAGALLYPLGATLSRTEGLEKANRTLDGLAFARTNAEDFSVLGWLRRRAGRDEVIMEATGGQYSTSARIAAWTGIPTVIGWGGHEVQWGRDNAMLTQRQQDVDRAYTTESLAEALSILRKYRVTYVFVGGLERSKYPPAGLQKFASGLRAEIETGQSAVYRVPIAGELAGPVD